MVEDAKEPSPSALSDDELNDVAGGQQLYKHQFPNNVDQKTGLRPFELPINSDRQSQD